MATLAVPSIEPTNVRLIAPKWHTSLLIALFLTMALSGAFFQRHARAHSEMLQQHPNVVPLYLYAIVMEAGLLVYVWRGGLRRAGIKPSELIGGRWISAKDVLVDIALALGVWGSWTLIETSLVRWLGPGHAKSIQALLPRGPLEVLLWIVVSISAGICEEFVFRGYFQKQFAAFTHSRWIALVLQALLFGISHGYQGIEACLRIALYGFLFGLLALWRKSLRPGMMAHAMSDIVGGIFGI